MEGLERNASTGLGLGRVALGAGIWLAPARVMPLLGLRGPGPTELAIARVAGIRDLVLGVQGVLAGRSGEAEQIRAIAIAGAVCDTGDAIAFAKLTPSRPAAGAIGVVMATGAAGLGAWLASRA